MSIVLTKLGDVVGAGTSCNHICHILVSGNVRHPWKMLICSAFNVNSVSSTWWYSHQNGRRGDCVPGDRLYSKVSWFYIGDALPVTSLDFWGGNPLSDLLWFHLAMTDCSNFIWAENSQGNFGGWIEQWRVCIVLFLEAPRVVLRSSFLSW
jgi:hypothetical protein